MKVIITIKAKTKMQIETHLKMLSVYLSKTPNGSIDDCERIQTWDFNSEYGTLDLLIEPENTCTSKTSIEL